MDLQGAPGPRGEVHVRPGAKRGEVDVTHGVKERERENYITLVLYLNEDKMDCRGRVHKPSKGVVSHTSLGLFHSIPGKKAPYSCEKSHLQL